MAPDPCSLPLDEGSCTAYTLRWYHRAVAGSTEACHPFVYGGCGGNANRFGTREACERRCSPRAVQSQGTGMGPPASPALSLPRSWVRVLSQKSPQMGSLGKTLQTKEPNREPRCGVPSVVPPCSHLERSAEDALSEVGAPAPMALSSHPCGSFTWGCSVACELGEVRWLKTAPNLPPPQVLSRAEARRTS